VGSQSNPIPGHVHWKTSSARNGPGAGMNRAEIG
jgi:hypothetical protein